MVHVKFRLCLPGAVQFDALERSFGDDGGRAGSVQQQGDFTCFKSDKEASE